MCKNLKLPTSARSRTCSKVSGCWVETHKMKRRKYDFQKSVATQKSWLTILPLRKSFDTLNIKRKTTTLRRSSETFNLTCFDYHKIDITAPKQYIIQSLLRANAPCSFCFMYMFQATLVAWLQISSHLSNIKDFRNISSLSHPNPLSPYTSHRLTHSLPFLASLSSFPLSSLLMFPRLHSPSSHPVHLLTLFLHPSTEPIKSFLMVIRLSSTSVCVDIHGPCFLSLHVTRNNFLSVSFFFCSLYHSLK